MAHRAIPATFRVPQMLVRAKLSDVLHAPLVPLILAAAAICGVLTSVIGCSKTKDPLLSTPQIALQSLSAKALYFNGAAQPWLLASRPDLLTPEDRDARSGRSRAFAQAAAAPRLFRQLDRKDRFDTVLLVGDPTQYRALLDHLIETKDFGLAYVDHTCLVFKRDAAAAWSAKALESLRQRLGGASRRERADCLALTAGKLAAAHRTADAKALIDEALALDERSPEAWTASANYHVTRGDWPEALAAADRALALDADHLGALATRTQIFYATKRYDQALAVSQRVSARLPDDPNVLFKHAQIAHEAHAFQAEIAALEKVIALAETDHRPTTGYRLYLAQAYTAAGKGQPAIENFNRVLADPELPEDQRKFASESIARIKSRTGL